MIWLTEILKIYQEEQLLIKYYVMKHIILLKILNVIVINMDLLQWCINLLIKRLLMQTKEQELILKTKN